MYDNTMYKNERHTCFTITQNSNKVKGTDLKYFGMGI